MRQWYLFFKMIIPRIMFAISDPCEQTRERSDQNEVEVTDGGYVTTEKDEQHFLLIGKSCVTARRC